MLGFLNLFKPAGPTSTQFGARLRRIYATEDGSKLAVGHLGTLDPQAAGVLAGRAWARDAVVAADRGPAQGVRVHARAGARDGYRATASVR